MSGEGIINLLKPASMTSHDCVYALRRLTGIKRIGHTGTLDPMAAGVLPLCVGNATRIIEYLGQEQKKYRCEMQLGIETDTLDIWGTVLADRREAVAAAGVRREELEALLASFQGEQLQRPPDYSAIKVNGRKLYEYARKGQAVEAAPRQVFIESIKLLRWDAAAGRALFDVVCSKGTYVRSLCRDVGQALGTGAAMSFLLRTESGAFRIEDAVTLEELASEGWERHLLPADYPLGRLGRLVLVPERAAWFGCGGPLVEQDLADRREPAEGLAGTETGRKDLSRVYTVYDGERFLGTALYNEAENRFLADKVFCR